MATRDPLALWSVIADVLADGKFHTIRWHDGVLSIDGRVVPVPSDAEFRRAHLT